MKIYLILFNVFILSYSLQAQLINKEFIDSIKVEIYKFIILSSKIKNTDPVLVSIRSLDIKFKKEYKGLAISTIQENTDTISVNMLKRIMPENYWLYEENENDKYEEISTLILDRFNNPAGENQYRYNYIRIYEPLDKWKNLYFYYNFLEGGKPYEIIPVIYAYIDNMDILKKKYMFYEVRFSKQGKIESVKVVN